MRPWKGLESWGRKRRFEKMWLPCQYLSSLIEEASRFSSSSYCSGEFSLDDSFWWVCKDGWLAQKKQGKGYTGNNNRKQVWIRYHLMGLSKQEHECRVSTGTWHKVRIISIKWLAFVIMLNSLHIIKFDMDIHKCRVQVCRAHFHYTQEVSFIN